MFNAKIHCSILPTSLITSPSASGAPHTDGSGVLVLLDKGYSTSYTRVALSLSCGLSGDLVVKRGAGKDVVDGDNRVRLPGDGYSISVAFSAICLAPSNSSCFRRLQKFFPSV